MDIMTMDFIIIVAAINIITCPVLAYYHLVNAANLTKSGSILSGYHRIAEEIGYARGFLFAAIAFGAYSVSRIMISNLDIPFANLEVATWILGIWWLPILPTTLCFLFSMVQWYKAWRGVQLTERTYADYRLLYPIYLLGYVLIVIGSATPLLSNFF